MQINEPKERQSNALEMDAESIEHLEAALHYLQMCREVIANSCVTFPIPILLHYRDQVELAIERCLSLSRNVARKREKRREES